MNEQLQWLRKATKTKRTKMRNLKTGDIIQLNAGRDNNSRAVMYWQIKSIELRDGIYTMELEGITGKGAPVRTPFVTETSPATYTARAGGVMSYEVVLMPEQQPSHIASSLSPVYNPA